MRVITCCKAVPEEQDIIVEKNRELNLDKAEWKFGTYDMNAVEAGKQIVEAVGGQLSGLSFGGKQLDNSKIRKDVLSRGLDNLYLVLDEKLQNADTFQTAKVLEAAIKKMEDFDLVLFGAGSSDLYAQQVGNQVGELLGIPVVNSVNKITPQDDKVIVERVLENSVQVLEVSLPAVISVTSEINVPRIAGMKDILAANKKTVTKFTLEELEVTNLDPSSTVVSTLAPEQVDRKLNILEGDSDEVIDEFVKLLNGELK